MNFDELNKRNKEVEHHYEKQLEKYKRKNGTHTTTQLLHDVDILKYGRL